MGNTVDNTECSLAHNARYCQSALFC